MESDLVFDATSAETQTTDVAWNAQPAGCGLTGEDPKFGPTVGGSSYLVVGVENVSDT